MIRDRVVNERRSVMKIGFVGTGNMGTAIIKGYLASNPGNAAQIYAYDKDIEKVSELARELGINSCNSVTETVSQSDFLLLAVKPNVFRKR